VRVVDQTERRVLRGEQVPAQEKVVSIFEPHTDIIIKKKRETEFGHKLCLTTGASSLVLDCVIEDGNPADSTLAVGMVERQRDIYGKVPRQVAFDGGFASRANLDAIKAMDVKDVMFSKGRGLAVTEMVKSTWVFKRLWRFRAGVEGCISFLKRCFGLDLGHCPLGLCRARQACRRAATDGRRRAGSCRGRCRLPPGRSVEASGRQRLPRAGGQNTHSPAEAARLRAASTSPPPRISSATRCRNRRSVRTLGVRSCRVMR
jgi:IS5 family transposase